MSDPIEQNVNQIPENTPETSTEKTFTQAEVDALIGKRIAKAMKGMPGEEELANYRAWKESQQTEAERWETVTKERDTARTELSAAQTELEQYKREKFLLSKGVPADDVDYYAFKIGKLVTDDLPFEKAAEEYLKEEKPAGTMKVDFSAPIGGGKSQPTPNEQMNNILRGFRK